MTNKEIAVRAQQMADLYDRRPEAAAMLTEAQTALEQMQALHRRKEQAAQSVFNHAQQYAVTCEKAPVQLRRCKEISPGLFDQSDVPRLTPQARRLIETTPEVTETEPQAI